MAAALVLLLVLGLVASPAGAQIDLTNADHDPDIDDPVVELTDRNFDALVGGPQDWLIEIHAPWCATCRELERPWNELAVALRPNVRVAKIDVTANPTLARRFGVRHLPSIFHVKGGETRELETLTASVPKLAAFAEGGWRRSAPRSACASPSSRCGRVLGAVAMLPSRTRDAVRRLHDEHHYSPVTIMAGTLLVPVVAGLALVGALDVYCSHAPSSGEFLVAPRQGTFGGFAH